MVGYHQTFTGASSATAIPPVTPRKRVCIVLTDEWYGSLTFDRSSRKAARLELKLRPVVHLHRCSAFQNPLTQGTGFYPVPGQYGSGTGQYPNQPGGINSPNSPYYPPSGAGSYYGQNNQGPGGYYGNPNFPNTGYQNNPNYPNSQFYPNNQQQPYYPGSQQAPYPGYSQPYYPPNQGGGAGAQTYPNQYQYSNYNQAGRYGGGSSAISAPVTLGFSVVYLLILKHLV